MPKTPPKQEIKYKIDLKAVAAKWSGKEGNLIMILHEIQNTIGFVPREISLELSQLMNIPLARIYEVLTFYNFFKTDPPGKHHISICLGTACYLKGAPALIAEAERILQVKTGETTKDGMFYLDNVRCVGCCGLAPVVVIDNQVHAKVTKDQMPELISSAIKEGEVKTHA